MPGGADHCALRDLDPEACELLVSRALPKYLRNMRFNSFNEKSPKLLKLCNLNSLVPKNHLCYSAVSCKADSRRMSDDLARRVAIDFSSPQPQTAPDH
jgi:hypothetical protein